MGFRIRQRNATSQSHDVDPVGYLEYIGHVVADQNDRQAAIAYRFDEVKHLPSLANTQCSRRFIHDHELAGEYGGARHRDTLSLPAGEILHRVGDSGQAKLQLIHMTLSFAFHFWLIEHTQPAPQRAGSAQFATEIEVARDIKRGRDRQLLIDSLDPSYACIERAAEMDRLSVQQDFAFVWIYSTAQHLNEGTLPCAIVADDRQDLTIAQLEVDPA